jgi:alpha-tubulin suppressor-like RCC1 family protein
MQPSPARHVGITGNPGLRRSAGLALVVVMVGWAFGVTPPASAAVGGTAWTVGQGDQGQLGSGARANRGSFGQAVGPVDVAQVDGGRDHVIARDGNGSVWTWGNGALGSLGLGTTADALTPKKVPGLSGVRQVTAGHYHSLALLPDGTIRSWGGNEFGQVGDGTTTNRLSPVVVGGSATPLSNVVEVAAGRDFSLAIKSTGVVWAWGGGGNGELGNGTTPLSRPQPARVASLTGVVTIAGGRNHALALLSNGSVWAWGLNSSGQLGDGTRTSRSTPVKVSGVANAVAIAAGADHSVAVLSDGRVLTWGEGESGQLGSGSTADRLTAGPVTGLGGVAIKTADCGRDHTLLIARSGRLWSFGKNDYGQLGDGSNTQRLTPYRVVGISDAVEASGGRGYTVVLRAPGA